MRVRRLGLTALAAVIATSVLTWPAVAATPVLTTQASPSGFFVGTPIFDVATLGLGQNPTGTITFNLFGPDNPTCAGPPSSSPPSP